MFRKLRFANFKRRVFQQCFSENYENDSFKFKPKSVSYLGASVIGVGAVGFGFNILVRKVKADSNQKTLDDKNVSLPLYSQEDVKKHGKESERIWVTYKDGVYDVTDFIAQHPGGDKILLAAGAAVDPYWALYSQHKTNEVLEILESFRIGRLELKDVKTIERDAFANDPQRHPALLVRNEKPFNAESPPSLLTDHFYTPNELFFVRNHLPVPDIETEKHKLVVQTLNGKTVSLNVNDIRKKFKAYTIGSVIQCAGNRRADMNQYKKVQGLMWEGTAISNAKWTGARLKDILVDAGVDIENKDIKHIHFEGCDIDATGTPYGASIPFKKAIGDEVIIAYLMNGEEIPRDHGAPLRAIVPGNVGARQVKWLQKIVVSDKESDSHWQQKDYRAFSPAVQLGDELKWDAVPSIQEYPVQCAICTPASSTIVDREDGFVEISGYAWSGGGRGIIRIEISVDDGKTWTSCEMEQEKEQDIENMYAWTMFRAEVKIPENVKEFQIIAKAVDRSYNTQPETAAGIWNVRGLIHNAWHRVLIVVKDN